MEKYCQKTKYTDRPHNTTSRVIKTGYRKKKSQGK